MRWEIMTDDVHGGGDDDLGDDDGDFDHIDKTRMMMLVILMIFM